MKTCLVTFALPARQWTWRVTLDDTATVADALARAREQAGTIEVPWEADVGIFGELCARDAVPRRWIEDWVRLVLPGRLVLRPCAVELFAEQKHGGGEHGSTV